MQDHLVIEPLGRSHGDSLQFSNILIGNTFIILKEDVLLQKFRGTIPHFDPGQAGIEVSPAVFTSEFVVCLSFFSLPPSLRESPKFRPSARGASIFSRPSDFQHTGRNRQHFRYCHVRQTEYDPFHRVLLLWSE